MLKNIPSILKMEQDGINPHAIQTLDQGEDRFIKQMAMIKPTEAEQENRIASIKSAFIPVARDVCESPIEQVMLAALCFADYGYADELPHIHNLLKDNIVPNRRVVIIPQFQIARYRLDFLVLAKTDDFKKQKWTAVECDGYDYHSNLEEVARDKKRDAHLKSINVDTLRYEGKSIWRHQEASADEIAAAIEYWRNHPDAENEG